MPILPRYASQLLRAARQNKLVTQATLTIRTPGPRTPGQPSSGTNLVRVDYPCMVQVDDFSASELQRNTTIVMKDKKISIYGASLQMGIEPAVNQEITVEGKPRQIIAVISRDAAAALYICQCRG